MDAKTIAAVAAILVVVGAGYAVAKPANGSFWNGMMGNGGYGGMMGFGNGGMMNGLANGFSGMMHGFWNGLGGMMGFGNGGMMGYGRGMMGNSNGGYGDGGFGPGHCGAGASYPGYGVNATPVTIDKAKESVEQYIASTGNSDLALTEIMEFNNHFYAEIKEKSTGIHAFELIVDKYTGAVAPEMGPNMMWNTKYGHMSWNTSSQATVTKEQAQKYAQAYLDKAFPGTKAGEADAFYGYYTLHVLKDGKIYGMLSVNSYTGAVWYHNWHGEFVKMLEVE